MQIMEETKMVIRMVQRISFGTEVRIMTSNGKNQYITSESIPLLDPSLLKTRLSEFEEG